MSRSSQRLTNSHSQVDQPTNYDLDSLAAEPNKQTTFFEFTEVFVWGDDHSG